MPVSKGNTVLPKAVDRFGPDVLSASWADLSDDKSPFMHKQGALRALAALAHSSLTSKPDDPTYVGGLFVTLQSLLDSLDSIQAKRSTFAGIIAQHTAAGAADAKKKSSLQEFRARMEVWALMRTAFSAARVALSKAGIDKIAVRSFKGICSADPVGARHALALASLAARDGVASRMYIAEVGPALKHNVDLAKTTGMLFSGSAATLQTVPGAPPTISREQPEGFLNLKDTWARVYLARGCAAVIQSGHIAGDIAGKGEVFWEALQLLALADPSHMVALEAIRAMFGAPYPRAESLKKRAGVYQGDQEAGLSKVYGASWHMMMSVADGPATVPERLQVGLSGAPAATDSSTSRSLFTCLCARLMLALKLGQRSLMCAACKTIGIIAEARTWCTALSGGHALASETVQKQLAKLQAVLQAIMGDSALGACERSAAVEALLWLQEPGGQQPLVTPGQLLKCMAQGGSSVPTIVRVLFADPWPEGLISSFFSTLMRCLRCAGPAAVESTLELALAAAAAAPSRLAREQLVVLLDTVPGPAAARAAASLLSSPLPPITQPNTTSPVEVKLLATQEEAAYEGLRSCAAWWLGEHANQVAGTSAWKPVGPKPVELQLGPGVQPPSDPAERLALVAATQSPLLALIISHLQRALLTGCWEVRCTAAQALAKVAVRSREPYRIQCYSALAATQQLPVAGAAASVDLPDMMGLAAVVRPVLEVLDAMYAGELVVQSHVATLGRTASSWPKAALASLQRRHDYLLFAVQQRIGFVPKDVFFPLGPFSKRLLKPDEPLDEEEEEEEKEHKAAHLPKGLPKNILEAATAAAAAAVAAEQEKQEPAQPQYDEQYYDEQYDQQYYDQQYYDQPYYNEDGTPIDYGDGYYGQAAADPLAEWQEGSYAGGIAPKVAVHIPDEAELEAANNMALDATLDDEDYRWGTVQFDFAAEGEDEVSVSTGERIKVLMDMGDWLHVLSSSGTRGLVPASYVAVQAGRQTPPLSSASSMQYTNTGADVAAGGQYYYSEQQGEQMQGGASSMRRTTDEAVSSNYYQQSEPYSQYGAGYDAFGDAGDEYGDATAGRSGGGGLDDFGSALAAVAAVPRQQAAPEPRPSVDDSSTISTPAVVEQPSMEARPAVVMFDFAAETEAELTVRAGEQVTVGAEVDGWYQTIRDSDGVAGLIPASYVQLM